MNKPLTYTPILRNRQVELKAIGNVFESRADFTPFVIPLFEIIQERMRSNSEKTFIDDLTSFSEEHLGSRFMVDIARQTPTSSMAPAVRRFFISTSRNPVYVRDLYSGILTAISSVIPVVSLNPSAPDTDQYSKDAEFLKSEYGSRNLAYRIPVELLESLTPVIREFASEGDIALLDIGNTADPMHGLIRKACTSISSITNEREMRFIITDDPRPQSLRNKDLINEQPIYSISTSLKYMYRNGLGADGFGDYAGIASSYPSTGGAISPAAVFYDASDDVFVGFRQATSRLEDFSYIADDIVHSRTWSALANEHVTTCPGCKEIARCAQGAISHGNQTTWKRYTMEHYLYSMGEYMLSENSA